MEAVDKEIFFQKCMLLSRIFDLLLSAVKENEFIPLKLHQFLNVENLIPSSATGLSVSDLPHPAIKALETQKCDDFLGVSAVYL